MRWIYDNEIFFTLIFYKSIDFLYKIGQHLQCIINTLKFGRLTYQLTLFSKYYGLPLLLNFK